MRSSVQSTVLRKRNRRPCRCRRRDLGHACIVPSLWGALRENHDGDRDYRVNSGKRLI